MATHFGFQIMKIKTELIFSWFWFIEFEMNRINIKPDQINQFDLVVFLLYNFRYALFARLFGTSHKKFYIEVPHCAFLKTFYIGFLELRFLTILWNDCGLS